MAKKEKKYHYIYKTTCNVTGKYYIGMHSSDTIEDNYLGSGKRLRYSIRKYGVENHTKEILEYCNSRELLSVREKEIVSLDEIAKDDCLNLCIGGIGGPTRIGVKHSDETKEKIRKSLIGQKHSDERKLKISESGKGKHSIPMSDETKKKLSDVKKGVSSKLKNVPRSDDTKKKISESLKGNPKLKQNRKPLTNETKEKISKANKNKNGLKVYQLSLGGEVIKIWDSVNDAEKTLNIFHISRVCKGERKTSGGFKWSFI